jgi:hypothetical protein
MLVARQRERQRTRRRSSGSATIAGRMRRPLLLFLAAALGAAVPADVYAQDPPPPIPRFVLDLRGTAPGFPRERQLAESRGLLESELPGRGLGGEVGLHIYLFKWKAVTFGLGGQLTLARAVSAEKLSTDRTSIVSRAVTERYQAVTPQISFNFGDGEGWSYISGGLGPGQRTLVPAGGAISEIDEETLRTVNYGGGARWFIKPHLAFTFDVRFHDIDPGTPLFGRPGSPRSRLLIIGAGVAFK